MDPQETSQDNNNNNVPVVDSDDDRRTLPDDQPSSESPSANVSNLEVPTQIPDLTDGQMLLENEKFFQEAERLNTFSGWPKPFVSPDDLARVGFVYLGDQDLVKCVFCNGIAGNWKEGDIPDVEHERLFPNCPFLRGIDIRNVPCSASENLLAHELSIYWSHGSCEDVYDARGLDQDPIVHESDRRKTFSEWSVPFINADDLAEAGFVWLHEPDYVKCVFCNGIVCDWEEGDIPIVEHRRFFPDCEFIKGYDVGNISITGGKNLRGRSADDCKLVDSSVDFTDSQTQSVDGAPSEPDSYTSEDVIRTDSPKHPDYVTMQQRLASFTEWSPKIPQRPEVLAAAGFYYAGIADHVTCFNCGGGLRNWEEEDNPWLLHVRLLEKCSFLLEFYTKIKKHGLTEESPGLEETHETKLTDDETFEAVKNYFQCLNPESLYNAYVTVETELEQSLQNLHIDDDEKSEPSENEMNLQTEVD